MNKSLLLFAGVGVLVIIWVIVDSQSSNEFDLPPLNDHLCPEDESLVKKTNLILLDFSDKLPKIYIDRPQDLINEIYLDAEQFSKIFIYKFNPYNIVPVEVNSFCKPFSFKSLPEEERKRLWGRDPDKSAEVLPQRFKQYEDTLRKVWSHEEQVKKLVKESIHFVGKQKQRESQSLLIENIFEAIGIAASSISNLKEINMHILSDMLQNNRQFSHYRLNRKQWNPNKLKAPDINIDNGIKININIDLLQTCYAYTTNELNELKDFWQNIFQSINAKVKYNVLRNKNLNCHIVPKKKVTQSNKNTANITTNFQNEKPVSPTESNKTPSVTTNIQKDKPVNLTQNNQATLTITPTEVGNASVIPATDNNNESDAPVEEELNCDKSRLIKKPISTLPKRVKLPAQLIVDIDIANKGKISKFTIVESTLTRNNDLKKFDKYFKKYLPKLLDTTQLNNCSTQIKFSFN